MKPVQKTAVLSSSTVSYWAYGDPSLPVLVMMHGFRGTHHGLERIAQSLKEYYILAPDLPAFGSSGKLAKAHSIEAYANFLDEFVASLQLQRYDLLGHSFGSLIVGKFAASKPIGLRKLILVNPISTPALKGSKWLGSQLALFYYWVARVLPEQAGNALLANKHITNATSKVLTKTSDQELKQFIKQQHLEYFSRFYSRETIQQAFQESISHTIQEYAANITVPTLLIAGEKDDIAPLEGQKRLLSSLNTAQLHVVRGVGHLIHYEAPGEAATAIQQFLLRRD